MRHPFQCLQVCYVPGPPRGWILLAAAGSRINSFALSDSALLSTLDIGNLAAIQGNGSQSAQPTGYNESDQPPEGKPETSNQVATILTVTATRDFSNVAVVTGEDKCIRVFRLQGDGHLHLLSARSMPKRPCAIVITPDDSTILCADKFGDVYSLPLHTVPQPISGGTLAASSESQIPSAPRRFVPSANSLTVHTARNLRALENQLRTTNKPSEKTGPNFEHQLLLGHVSMLTDITYVKLDELMSPHGKPCSYILTADRDEHIRVSRGPPQAHIIETFCLGHKEFVSKLCIPHWLPTTLISGGGDGFLYVWSWAKGSVLQKLDMKLLVDEYISTHVLGGRDFTEQTYPTAEGLMFGRGSPGVGSEVGEGDTGQGDVRGGKGDEAAHIHKLVVSGIWSVSQAELGCLNGGEFQGGDILVACEGVSALFVFTLTMDSALIYRDSVPLEGNVLDVAIFSDGHSIVVSVDTLHERNSTNVARGPPKQEAAPLQVLSRSSGGSWSGDGTADQVEALNRQGSFEIKTGHNEPKLQALSDLFYKYQNLRKQEFEE
ncbi:MAG: tRNA (guanine-N(7)-)-methyltransferase non-catalytic subunit trm82 [Geoglossum simile]|nr:MAG: tRNA (guanine-N(7)-)-methyltransferase non-catalytic subunit trm82 [Geoglossum simile]